MQITKKKIKDVVVLDIEGEIDIGAMESLSQVLNAMTEMKNRSVILNLRKVNHISYKGVNILVDKLQKMRSEEGDIRIVGINTYIRNILTLTGVIEKFSIYNTQKEAIGSFAHTVFSARHH